MLSIENVVELARAKHISYGRMAWELEKMPPGQIAAIEMDFDARDKKHRRKPPKEADTPEPKRKSGRWKHRKIEKYDQNGRVLAVYDNVEGAASDTGLEPASVYSICSGYQKDVRGAAARGFSLRWRGSKTVCAFKVTAEADKPPQPVRCIEKYNADGKVICTYRDMLLAANDNNVPVRLVSRDVKGLVKNPFTKRDFAFRYAEEDIV